MSTAAILPGFSLPAAATPQPEAAATLSAAVFGDLLSAFTGLNQQQDGQEKQDDTDTVTPDTGQDPQPTALSRPDQPAGWLMPELGAAPQHQALPTQELPTPADQSTTSVEAPPVPATPLTTMARADRPVLPVPTAPVPATVGQAGPIHLWPLSGQQTPQPSPTAARTAGTIPLTSEAAAHRAAPAAAFPTGSPVLTPGHASAAVPGTAAAAAEAVPAVIPPGLTPAPAIRSVLPTLPGAPVPAQAPAHQGQQPQPALPLVQEAAVPDKPAAAAGAETVPQAAAETPARVPDALPVQGQAAPVEAPRGSAQAVPAPAQAAAPQPVAAQLARPLFTLATEAPGEHVMIMKVSPEDLGPVTVRAHISAEGVRLEMFAAGEAGREAVRAALPELRRELALQGLTASLDLSGRSSPDHGQPHQEHRANQDQGGPYRSNLRMVTDAEPTPGQPARTLSSTAALDVVA